MSFSAPYTECKTRSAEFYHQINSIINCKSIETLISIAITPKRIIFVTKSRTAVLVLFKMLLIGIWNDLSDKCCKDFINESVFAMRFYDLALENSVLDHSSLSRFRTEMTQAHAFDKLLKEVNKQLAKHKLILKTCFLFQHFVL